MIRLTYVLRRLPNLSLEEFQRYWHDVHGPLVASFSTTMGLSRYIQLHTIDDPILKTAREARNMVEPYDGVAELISEQPKLLTNNK